MNRRNRLIRRFQHKEYRDTYVESFLNSYIAAQIRALREARGLNQEELAKLIGTKQSGVSKLEDVNYSGWSVRTLKNLAKAFDVALVVKFVSFREALDEIETFNIKALVKPAFTEEKFSADIGSELAFETTDVATRPGPIYTSTQIEPRRYQPKTTEWYAPITHQSLQFTSS